MFTFRQCAFPQLLFPSRHEFSNERSTSRFKTGGRGTLAKPREAWHILLCIKTIPESRSHSFLHRVVVWKKSPYNGKSSHSNPALFKCKSQNPWIQWNYRPMTLIQERIKLVERRWPSAQCMECWNISDTQHTHFPAHFHLTLHRWISLLEFWYLCSWPPFHSPVKNIFLSLATPGLVTMSEYQYVLQNEGLLFV